FLLDDLEGDRPAHGHVDGLEDRAHAAFAEAVEQPIRADDKVPARTLAERVDLVRGEQAALDQLARQGHWVVPARLRKAGDLVQPPRFEQLEFAQIVDEGGDATGSHHCSSRGKSRGWQAEATILDARSVQPAWWASFRRPRVAAGLRESQ